MLYPSSLFFIGLTAGGVLALTFRKRRFGCWSLILVPIATSVYVGRWQSQHPELLRSTSGLEFLFVQPPALIGALAGYGLVAFIVEYRSW